MDQLLKSVNYTKKNRFMIPIEIQLYNQRNYPKWVIYFLLLNDNEIYVGITIKSVKNRIKKHIKCKGSIHTANKKIQLLKIIKTEKDSQSEAAKLENRAAKLTQTLIKDKKVWGGCFY